MEIERIARSDSYFVERNLYPNVDFYSGLIYEAMGLPVDTYTTIFAVARMAGWIAQWLELIDDPEQKIARPKQLYVGPGVEGSAGLTREAGHRLELVEAADASVRSSQ